jgi:hypothetical protein
MREQINENPAVQAVLVGILVLACVFMLWTRVISGGSSGEAPPPPPTSSDAATTAPPTASAEAPAASAPAPTAPDATSPGVDAPEPPPGTDVAAGGLEAGKGMPEPVVSAYEDGKAVVLLIVRQAGVDDKRVKTSVQALEADPRVAVFVTGARNVARYSQIANGVGVNRVPALIVMKPRSVSEGGMPVASVSYGFRGPASVVQAVKDALYEGKNIPYYPE